MKIKQNVTKVNGMLKDVVREAGEILKEGFFQKVEVEKKGSVDLVTEYDRKIEVFLKERLLGYGLPVVGEESFEGEIPASAIFVDPIDGTTNFVHKLPFCAISVGVWIDGEPVEGVVYNPVLDELFWAKKGKGAWLNEEPIGVSGTDGLIDALVATGFPYAKAEDPEALEFVLESMRRLLPRTRDIRRFGSASLDLCYVAAGRFDAFFEMGLRPWDVAAGIVMVREAGGVVSNDRGEEYRFEDVIVASPPAIHRQLIEALGG